MRTWLVLALGGLNLVLTPWGVRGRYWALLARWNFTVAGSWAALAGLNFLAPLGGPRWMGLWLAPLQVACGQFHWMVGHLYLARVYRPRRWPPRWDGHGEYP